MEAGYQLVHRYDDKVQKWDHLVVVGWWLMPKKSYSPINLMWPDKGRRFHFAECEWLQDDGKKLRWFIVHVFSKHWLIGDTGQEKINYCHRHRLLVWICEETLEGLGGCTEAKYSRIIGMVIISPFIMRNQSAETIIYHNRISALINGQSINNSEMIYSETM